MEQPYKFAIILLNKHLKEQVKAFEHVTTTMTSCKERVDTLKIIEDRIKQLNAAIIQLAVL
jgi:hypothetical protein